MPAKTFQHFVDMAQTAERGLFDFLFSADSATVFTTNRNPLHRSHYVAWIEPLSLLTALAACTRNIGLVSAPPAPVSRSPILVARRFASLDLISGGRGGWNVVTTGNPIVAREFWARAASAQVGTVQTRARVYGGCPWPVG